MTGKLLYVLVTGATGFIGAHIVDELLQRRHKVLAATRSATKANFFKQTRSQFTEHLSTIQISDLLSESTSLEDAVQQVDAVIHVASPFSYDVQDNEKQLVRPAVAGVKKVLEASTTNPNIKRVVITSSFASIMDANRTAPPPYSYTAEDWNPLTYEEAVGKETSAVVAYRGSKKFAELAAWQFIQERKPAFDIVTLCPPMTFGPIAHPIAKMNELNESNAMLWKVAAGEELPVARVPFWIDVRDLARAHVEALIRPEAGGKRYTVASPEKFSYGLVAGIIREEFEWGRERVMERRHEVVRGWEEIGLDGETAADELGVTYRSFRIIRLCGCIRTDL
ncbi:NAD dependent epimerase/dehydratase [Lojkania enalia]|uniref:NAD dependent epimerase/dehydratase n=1 Tax=Lojkania enalia TaxID=147567 RepID=A0A9P4K0Y3_9PLEO|nr:NAD dependent epimerase/dehydratase [Didymosphaeria enalia]